MKTKCLALQYFVQFFNVCCKDKNVVFAFVLQKSMKINLLKLS